MREPYGREGHHEGGREQLRGGGDTEQRARGGVPIPFVKREADYSRRESKEIPVVEHEEEHGKAGNPAPQMRGTSAFERYRDHDGEHPRDRGADQEETKGASPDERHRVHREADQHRVLDITREVRRRPRSDATETIEVRHIRERMVLAENRKGGELEDQGRGEQARPTQRAVDRQDEPVAAPAARVSNSER